MTDEDRVVQHLHCPVCGKAIPPDEDFCSEACDGKMKKLVKKRKTYNYVFMALMMFLMFILLMSMGAPV